MSPIKSLLLLLIFAVFLPTFSRGIATAHGAAGALAACARIDDGLVFVPFVTDPPDFAVAGGRDVVWGECAVFGEVPFFCNGGILTGQVVFTGDDLLAGTDWAAAALGAA